MSSGVEVNLNELLQLRHSILSIEIAQKKKMTTSQQGQYLSLQRGRGMDFAETRAYHPGDDIRTMNWRVTARTGEPHTKVYQQERERPVFIIVDFTHTMFFGTKVAFKSVVASKIASIVAWSASHQKDRVGGIIFNDEKEIILQPKASSHGVIALLKQMTLLAKKTLPIKQKFDLLTALKKLRRIVKTGSVVYIISDFYNYSKELEKELQFLCKNHEVFNVLIYDNLEMHLPSAGTYLFHNQTDQTLSLDTSDVNLCAKYCDIFNNRLKWLQKLHTNGIHLIDVATHEDISHVLKQKFSVRK